jgi:hypothetical protein
MGFLTAARGTTLLFTAGVWRPRNQEEEMKEVLGHIPRLETAMAPG